MNPIWKKFNHWQLKVVISDPKGRSKISWIIISKRISVIRAGNTRMVKERRRQNLKIDIKTRKIAKTIKIRRIQRL
jgi:hypothetical protein